ncbi:MAG: hypothetical protein ACI9ZH_002524, partial [Paracoccaceae bacterium]
MSRNSTEATDLAPRGLLRRPARAVMALALAVGLGFGAAPAHAGGDDVARAAVGVAAAVFAGAVIIGALNDNNRGHDRGRVVYVPRHDDYYDRGRGKVVIITRPQTIYRSAPVRVIRRDDVWHSGRAGDVWRHDRR